MPQQYVHPEHFKAMQESVGPARAEAWRVKNNLVVGMPPEENTVYDNEPKDGAEEKDFAIAAAPSETQRKAAKAGDPSALAQVNAYSASEMAQQNVTKQIEANLARLQKGQEDLRNRRLGPTNAEKWFAIAAALGQPTRTGAFGESLGNLNKALYETKSAQREAQEKRETLLEKYGMDIGEQQLRMLISAANQAGQNYRAVAAANKPKAGALPKATVGPDFIPRTRYGTEIKQPPPAAVHMLQDYLRNPEASDEDKLVAKRNFDNKFGLGTAELFGGE